MSQSTNKISFLLGAASAALCLVAPAYAQEASEAPAQEEVTTAQEIVVLGKISYRNRSEEVAPVLEYGLDYFQRFEPLTVGDALKRVPSVAFLSDVIESDGVRLRGLDPAYTQILINGEQVPGSGSSSGAFGNGADQAFFVDRIPAELIERVEIVRSQSANRSGDAMAGAINIVLRDSYSLEGGFMRVGALHFDDDFTGTTYGGVYGTPLGAGRLLLGFNSQDRHNPKRKLSLRYDEPGAALNNNEVQTDTRDGTDTSLNLSYITPFLLGELDLSAFYVRTDRYEDEDSIEYTDGVVTDANIETVNDNNNDIGQTSHAFNIKYKVDMFGGETRLKWAYARFDGEENEFENEVEYQRDALPYPEGDRFTGDLIRLAVDDIETKYKIEHKRDLGFADLEVGVHFEDKARNFFVGEGRARFNIPGGRVIEDTESDNIPPFAAPAVVALPGGSNRLERHRRDPYFLLSGDMGELTWEAGVRYEDTKISVDDRTPGGQDVSNKYSVILPSAHVRYALSDNDRFSLSLARSTRNPSVTQLNPALLEEELEDNDFRGDPRLEPETAWGLDAGYERRIGTSGVAGVNFFYRDVKDVLELATALDAAGNPVEGSAGPGTFVYTVRNSGDGTVWGLEFDVSAPLTIVGLPDTGVFLNYSWLDSEITDEFGDRKFNSQSDYVFNVGFIQDLPDFGASFGATYRKQGEAFSRVISEEVTTEYGADLEAFVEQRIGERLVVRLVGSNLLNASKDEVFNKFVTRQDQIDRSFDEYELETEEAGPVYQLIARLAF